MFSAKPSMRHFKGSMIEIQDSETLDFCLDDVEIAFNPERGAIGICRVTITSKRVVLQLKDEFYEIDPQFIALHAITRDTSSYPKPCIYCQLGYGVEDDGEELEEVDNDESGSATETAMRELSEMYLAPRHDESLKDLYDAFSKLALLNPDEEEEGDEYDDDLIFNVDEVTLGSEQARALAHLESVFTAPTDDEQFCDT